MRTILITGTAGFIGFSLAARLLREGVWRVVGLDNLNDYYDPALKRLRLAELERLAAAHGTPYRFVDMGLEDRELLLELVLAEQPEVIVHLAAQASVRYGMHNQLRYLESNLVGHFNILLAAKALNEQAPGTLRHLLYASSSSVYGSNEKVPFSEADDVGRPQSLYAATKRADELITHAWCTQFAGTPGAFAASGLRFFTVYGPWGRPDMSPLLFAEAILAGQPIPLYNNGDLWRDFTYIDDIVEAICRLMAVPPAGNPAHEVYNLGNQNPVRMDAFVQAMGEVLERTPLVQPREWPATEVYKTYADTSKLKAAIGWAPFTPLADGLARFAAWYMGVRGQFRV